MEIVSLVVVGAILVMFWGVIKRSTSSVESVLTTALNAADTATSIADKKISIFAESQELADQVEMGRINTELNALTTWIELEDLQNTKASKRPGAQASATTEQSA